MRDFLSLRSVKAKLINGTLSNTRIFIYFLIIIALDNIQLAILQVAPNDPTPWTPYSVWISLAIGAIFLVGTYKLNGGSTGRDYLPRYFSISAIVAVWIAVPVQLVISLSRVLKPLAQMDWFLPAFILIVNVCYFSFVALQIYQVASTEKTFNTT